jgi:hypothetical protein
MNRWDLHRIPHPFNDKKDHQITQTITASSFHQKPIQFHPITCAGIQILDTFHQICIWIKVPLSWKATTSNLLFLL